MKARIVVVMGVSGSGKTTVGAALASQWGWKFLEADDFHSEKNWKRLSRGEPLTDADRAPWLETVRDSLANIVSKGESVVLACSALRQIYRDALVPPGFSPDAIHFVLLQGEQEIIAERLAARVGHRASPAILPSQFAILEIPANALVVDISQTPEQIIRTILRLLKD